MFRSKSRIGVLLSALLWLGAGCGDGVEGRMESVRSLQNVGRFAESIGELEQILAEQPDLPEGQYRLGLALVQTGEPSRAIWPLQKASESGEYAIVAGVLLASTHSQTRNYDEAVRAANRVLAQSPDRQAALRIRAAANLAARRHEDAFEDASKLVERYPGDYGVRVLYATVLTRLGRIDEAEREHAKLKELGEQSDNPALRQRACLAPAMFAQESLQDHERAQKLYEECALRGPTDAVAIQHLVSYFDQRKQPERATQLWRGAISKVPDDLSLRQGLAARFQALGDPASAEQVLVEAVEHFDSAPAWRLLAVFHRSQREPEKALEAIEKVIALNQSSDPHLDFLLADVLIDLGQTERALEVSQRLDQETYAHLLRGRIHLMNHEPEAALEEFDQGIRAWPNNAAARFLAGLAARDSGDYARAVSELREAVRAGNTETDASLELARIHLESALYPQAVAFADLALRGRGLEQPEAYVIAARALIGMKKYEQARRTLASLAQSGHETLAARERVWLERQVDGIEGARRAATQSRLDLSDTAQIEVLEQLVDAEISFGETQSALTRLDAALQRTPDDPHLHALRGIALAAAQRDDEAREAFERSLSIDPKHAASHAGLASLLAKAGKRDEAIERFDRAYQLAPRQAHYGYSAAQLVLESGNEKDAISRFRHIAEHHPGAVGARNDLAWLLAERGEELGLALSLALQAQRGDPSSTVLDTLGWVRFQRGEYEEAVSALEASLAAAPQVPSTHYRLARALEKLGETGRARLEFEAALAAGDFPEAPAARRQLAQLAGE